MGRELNQFQRTGKPRSIEQAAHLKSESVSGCEQTRNVHGKSLKPQFTEGMQRDNVVLPLPLEESDSTAVTRIPNPELFITINSISKTNRGVWKRLINICALRDAPRKLRYQLGVSGC